MRIDVVTKALVAGPLAVVALPAEAAPAPVYTSILNNVAVSGYDPVAYFTAGRPVKGSAAFRINHRGAEFRFASAANLARFRANPATYAPQFGGYCAWAVAQGYTAPSDPSIWKIVNGRLYLNYNREIGQRWEKNVPGFIRSGDANWPKLLRG